MTQVFDPGAGMPFFGVTDSRGIAKVVITSHTLSFDGPQKSANLGIDHVQYGVQVPEPGTAVLAGVGVVVCLLALARRSRPSG
jgi:hypothetical protein